MSDYEVLIVGGGIAGASLGAAIAARRKTLIIDAEALCGVHATGRSAAFYLESYGGPDVAKLTVASGSFLECPPSEFAEAGFLHRRGALHLSKDDWPAVPPEVEAHRVGREGLQEMLPGVKPAWKRALFEPGCADIDVAALHAAFLRRFHRDGGKVATDSQLARAEPRGGGWQVTLSNGAVLTASLVVNAAGAWADDVAIKCGAGPLGLAPKRRTMVQVRVGRSGLRDLPLVNDSAGRFYFKGEGDRSIWLSPHDEIPSEPCDAAPDEIDVATAIDRFQSVVDWPVEKVERQWAGLRTFAPDRLPVYGFDVAFPGFFWCAGQGGFGIQTSPAAASLAAALLLDEAPDQLSDAIDPGIFSPKRFS